MILTKLLGAASIVFGFMLIVHMPDAPEFQSPHMGWTFVFFGIFLILLGIYLIKL